VIEVHCPRGPRMWVAVAPGAPAGRLADKAARLFGYADDFVFSLTDGDENVLRRDEPVVDGDHYRLVPLRQRA
jgi:hypothetical protein